MLGRRTAVGGSWMVGARLVSRVIDLGTMLVLARILKPRDFGLVAIAMTVIFIIEAALELPVSQALVRLDVIEQEHYDTAFTLSLLRGLLLSALVCSVSWPFAHFYNDPRLLLLVCVLSIAPAARGLVSPKLADFSKRLDFSPDFIMEFAGKSIALTAAITLAFVRRDYWAIVAGTVIAPLAATITSYILAPYRPRLSLSRLPALSGFLGWITAAQVVSAFNWQTDRLLLGKLTSRSELGLFTAANDTAQLPLTALFTPILRPLLSAFSLVKDDARRLAQSYQSSATAVVTVGLPVLLGMSLVAYPAVRLLLGPQWQGSAPLLRLLSLSLIPSLFAMPLGPLVMTFGRTHIFFRRNLIEMCVKLPLVIFGAIKYGFMGVVVARMISECVTVCYCMTIVRGLVHLSIRQQLIAPWRSVVSAGAMVLTVSAVLPRISSLTALPALAAGLFIVAAIGAATYCSVLWLLWTASGSPAGLEAMAAGEVAGLLRRGRMLTAHTS